ncbi:hypothetical protein ENBRE01_0528 [Enteropsectra breve]|nr:hypothetical protein ENBRE01_0528 [Enteropsectra breve]
MDANEDFKLLKFKTGGMRGIMKEGFDGINDETCVLLGTALLACCDDSKISIGFDHRNNSERFAKILEIMFKSKGTIVRLFEHCITPYLAMESCNSLGIMITASHNASAYNGFKVYRDGRQIEGPFAEKVEQTMLALLENKKSSFYSNLELIARELEESSITKYERINYEKYFSAFKFDYLDVIKGATNIAFSALYGVSAPFMKRAAEYWNLKIDFSAEGNEMDAEFGGILHPNPELEEHYETLFNSCKSQNTDIKFMCDPDGDRFGMAVDGRVLNGNEIAEIFTAHCIKHLEKQNDVCLYLINTFLCSGFFAGVAQNYQGNIKIRHIQTHTGFKNISKEVEKIYSSKGNNYVIAYEDPLGFLIAPGTEKDGIKAAVLMAKILGECSLDEIREINRPFGVYNSHTVFYRIENGSHSSDNNTNCCSENGKVGYRAGESPLQALERILEKEWADMKMQGMFSMEHFKFKKDIYEIRKEDYKIFMRVSGTEPMIKLYFLSEKLSKETLIEKSREIISKLK